MSNISLFDLSFTFLWIWNIGFYYTLISTYVLVFRCLHPMQFYILTYFSATWDGSRLQRYAWQFSLFYIKNYIFNIQYIYIERERKEELCYKYLMLYIHSVFVGRIFELSSIDFIKYDLEHSIDLLNKFYDFRYHLPMYLLSTNQLSKSDKFLKERIEGI